jgi:hypothetical protein
MRKAKRVISKTKTYGFNPWVDQFDAISQIMADTGEKESTVLRKLIDEALIGRRRKIADNELAMETSVKGGAETLRAIQSLLVRLVGLADKSLRVHDVSLALLQDTLAEARAGRKVSWEQLVARLKERGLSTKEISKRFEEETVEGKNFAYSTAKEIKRRQKK